MTPPATRTDPAILKRRQREQKPRTTAYYDEAQGSLRFVDGSSVHLHHHAPFSAILDSLAHHSPAVVYLICKSASESAPQPEWYREPCHAGWQLTYRHDVPARRVASYTRSGDGARVDLRHSPAWWGDCTDARQMVSAHRLLEGQLRERFGVYALLLGTPAQTGLDLVDRALPFGVEYPLLELEVRDLLHFEFTQARRELYPVAGETIPGLYYYDARFAYAGCLRDVPRGPARWEQFPRMNGDYLGYTPALYLVAGRVPDSWRHVGFVPRKVDEDDPESGWEWRRCPGELVDGWITGMEYEQASAHGWELAIMERVTFAPNKGRGTGADPLESWQKKLVALWRFNDDGAAGALPGADPVLPLVRGAIRTIVLHTIGGFHRSDTKEQLIVPMTARVADTGEKARVLPGGLLQIERSVPISAAMARYDHPEWSTWIWAKQRVRLAAALLQYDPAQLVGCNTDAFYATAECPPALRDGGAIGNFRLKGHIAGERPAPRSFTQLLALKDESERGTR